MARYYGKIGFIETVESPVGSGIWIEQATEREYYGTIERASKRWQGTQTLNDDVNINNEFVVVMDEFANGHMSAMRYLEYMGAKWKITNITPEHPHLRLSIGGVYNGEIPSNAT